MNRRYLEISIFYAKLWGHIPTDFDTETAEVDEVLSDLETFRHMRIWRRHHLLHRFQDVHVTKETPRWQPRQGNRIRHTETYQHDLNNLDPEWIINPVFGPASLKLEHNAGTYDETQEEQCLTPNVALLLRRARISTPGLRTPSGSGTASEVLLRHRPPLPIFPVCIPRNTHLRRRNVPDVK